MSFSSNLKSEHVQQLKEFVNSLKACPSILHVPELKFFREYIESLGGRIPDAPARPPPSSTPKPEEPATASAAKEETSKDREPSPIPEFEEIQLDKDIIDNSGVIEPESEALPEIFTSEDGKEASEDDIESSNAKRSEAMGLMGEQDFAGAISAFTEAIKLNPDSAVLYAKRAQALLKQNRVKAVIADCNQAIQRNPDSALAHKLRGRAYRLLGEWINSAKDLRQACKLDCDEQAMEWLAEVTPNATKIEEHQRTEQRRRDEYELELRKERVRKAKKAQEEARKKAEEEFDGMPGGMGGMPGFMGGMPGGMGGMPGGMGGMPGGMGGMPGGMGGMPGGMGGMPGGMGDLFSDPELLNELSDPEVSAAFGDLMKNPMNIFKYKDNPKVAKVINKMKSKFGGGPGGEDDAPGSPPTPPTSTDAPPPPRPPTHDDLD